MSGEAASAFGWKKGVVGFAIFIAIELMVFLIGFHVNVFGKTLSVYFTIKDALIEALPSVRHSEQVSKDLAWDLTLSLGRLLQILTITISANYFLGNPIKLGKLRWTAPLWIAGAAVFAMFFLQTYDSISEKLFPTDNVYTYCNNITVWPENTGSYSLVFLGALSACLTGPVFEEAAFRGYLTGLCLKFWNHQISGSIVTLLFVLLHIEALVRFESALFIFMAGAALYLARWKSGGLMLPILMHVAANSATYAQTLSTCSH